MPYLCYNITLPILLILMDWACSMCRGTNRYIYIIFVLKFYGKRAPLVRYLCGNLYYILCCALLQTLNQSLLWFIFDSCLKG